VVFRIKGETKPCSASSECEVSVDSCASDGRTLREYYCSSSNANPVQSYAYVCPDGCSNGACISQLQNQAPVITSTSYPSELMVNEAGSFSIRAYDPEGGPIYAVADWGDGLSEKQESDSKAIAAGQGATFTFRHSFSSPGMQKPMFTIYDSSGMGTESSARVLVKNAQGANYFDAEVGVSPSEVAVGDNFKAFGKISYQPASELASGERKLMVVTKYLENEGRYMANKKGASLKSSEKASTSTFISPVSESEPVASIAIEKVPSDYQVRTDYITLAPGESTTITAFFTAKSLGTHKVSVEVYDITADDKSMSAAGIAGRKEPVASASTTIKVSREQPPNPPQGEMAIKLQKGWNMVSVPSEEVVTVSDIASVCDIPPHAWSYNAQSNSYQQATVLKAGYGYWIKADSDCEYKVVSPFVRTISQSLSAGWNMVGAPGSAAATSDFLGDCQVTSGPWYYSPGAGQYSYSATIKPGNAYWFKVARACTIGNWVVTPPAPPSS
jgi:glucan-binding YG repeat protein